MIVIVDHVTLRDEDGNKETSMETAKGFEEDIKELLRCGRLQMMVSYSF